MSQNILACANSMQTRRHGGHFGAVPPQISCCAPPKRCVCPQSWEKYRKIVRKTWILGGKRGPVRAKTFFFFFGLHLILGGETGPVWAETFFFGLHLILGGKTGPVLAKTSFRFGLDFLRDPYDYCAPKASFVFGLHLSLCPPNYCFCPPSHAALAPGLVRCQIWIWSGSVDWNDV